MTATTDTAARPAVATRGNHAASLDGARRQLVLGEMAVPQLLPAEGIADEGVAHLSRLAVTGARLHGASDPDFKTINVLVQEG